MSKAGTTVFVTTHYMDEADYCDRLALIYRGAIIAEGTPSELRQQHMTRDVLEIETENAVLTMEALGRQGVETAIFGSVLHATVGSAPEDIPRLRNLLAGAGITVHRIEKIIPSLEDVFVTLIEQS
jgi:ABC-2 type transport system ATP-binding protein